MAVVKLSVHKNTLNKRKEKEMRKQAIGYFKECINKPDTCGYAVVTWDIEGKVTSCSNTSDIRSPITKHTLPEVLKMTFIDRFING